MDNKYLEKIALSLPSLGSIKSTLTTAMGKGVQRVDGQIAKRQALKSTSQIKQRGINSVPNQPGAGINLGKNDLTRRETKRQLRTDSKIDQLSKSRDAAELAMHRARATVGKAALGVGAAGVVGHTLLKKRETYPQGY